MATIKPGMITDWDMMEKQVQFYRDHLDIFIEEQFAPIKLTKRQHVIARAFGTSDDIKVVCSRGFGKSFLIGLCAFAFCSLYPGTIVAVCSGTAAQATIVFQRLKMFVDHNNSMAAELSDLGARTLVQLSKDKAKCTFKNGSVMESFALGSMRGQRAKIIIVDEALEVSQADLDAIVSPIKNFKRDLTYSYGFQDFASKTVSITSACEKNNTFYDEFKRVAAHMGKDDPGYFACALNYEAAIDDGLEPSPGFFEKERARMPAAVFAMEYDSIFQGATSNSAFPYELTEGCRTLRQVEIEQPKNSKSRYIMSIDIATSEASTADNSIISVLKFTERTDGSFAKKLVNIRSFHGKGLDVLANEVRQIFHLKFPNVERIIYDARGLGDSFSKFFLDPWVDPSTGKEYPALVHDDEQNVIPNAIPVLHAVRAVQTLNQKMATSLRVMLEKRTIELPLNSRILQAHSDEDSKKMTPQELAIFIEADALQFEMGNIVAKVSASGNYIYDTPRLTMHKDRYSSLAMGCDYIADIEDENIKKKNRGPMCIGIATDY